ncbi:MAG: M3 family oligoendopeptidase [Hyphomicrobiales bacterium]|nr:M3 family oligoendopeptidase [Hyphomicrobiales bacterium]
MLKAKMPIISEFLSQTSESTTNANVSLGDLPQWDLGDLYESMASEAYSGDMERVLVDAQEFENSYAGKLTELARNDTDSLANSIQKFEQFQDDMGRLMSYAVLNYFGDTSNAAGAKFFGDAQENLTNASAHLLFYTLEINQIDDEVLDLAIKSNAVLGKYWPWFEDLRKDKPYQLEDRIEKLFHDKSLTGRSAWNRLFDETMSSLRFDIDGMEMTSELAFNQLQDVDRTKRQNAALEISRVLKENSRVFTLITNTLAKDKEISDRWRGYEDIADSRHLDNRVERAVVNALVDTVRTSFPRLSHRYYTMKAKWLGFDKMQHWDRNAPLPDQSTQVFKWDQARDIVLDAYRGFAPEMADIAKRFFDERWIDAPVREGKSSGAFSHPTVPSAHPYVLVNYQGKPRDVMTLAHELGHGVHQVLAGKQGALMAPTPLTLAETASVFGEMLTFRSLLDQAENPKERKILLAQKVEDMLNTVVRQIAFYLFERGVHGERRNGELTSERIGEIWLEVQKESLGPAFEFESGYSSYWSYIPHFIHSPFYVYAYAFGDCLVNSLFAVYTSSESGFQSKYFDMLAAGGTKHHSQMLAPFGLDASDPKFWYKGLGMIEEMISEIEELEGLA